MASDAVSILASVCMGMLKNLFCKVVRLGFLRPNIYSEQSQFENTAASREALPEPELSWRQHGQFLRTRLPGKVALRDRANRSHRNSCRGRDDHH
jgi:hypothetical protein